MISVKELFMVDSTLVGVLVALVLFVVFVVIYKSKQNFSTTYYNDDEAYEDITEIEEAEEIEHKTTKSPDNIDEEGEIDLVFISVWAVCLAVVYAINKKLDATSVMWSIFLVIGIYTAIALFVPEEIRKRFSSKKHKNN